MKNPKDDCALLLCGDHVHGVLLRVCGFRLPLGLKCLGKGDQYQLRGIELTSVLGSMFMGMGVHPCLVTSCKVM